VPDRSADLSSAPQAPTPRVEPSLVLFALEPAAYSEAIAGAIGRSRPELEVLALDPVDLHAEAQRRRPRLVLAAGPRPEGLAVAPRWAQYRPYEDPEVVRVDGVPHRFPALDLGDLLGLVDRICEGATEAAG